MKSKPTEQEYHKALEIIRAYAPERYINVKEINARNNNGHNGSSYVVLLNGYLQMVTETGEIILSNQKLSIIDNINEPLTAIGQFHVRLGEVIK